MNGKEDVCGRGPHKELPAQSRGTTHFRARGDGDHKSPSSTQAWNDLNAHFETKFNVNW